MDESIFCIFIAGHNFFKKINQIKFDFKLFFVQPKNSILTDYL